MLLAPGSIGRVGLGLRRVGAIVAAPGVAITLGTDPITTDDTPTIGGYVTNPGGSVDGLVGDVYLNGVLNGNTSTTDATGFWTYTFGTLSNALYDIEVIFPTLVVSDEVLITVDAPVVSDALDFSTATNSQYTPILF